MDPIKIPQNVYVEDRIIGSLTLRQIIIVIIGGGIGYTFYAFMQKTYGYVGIPLIMMSSIPLLISLAFAFVRIHDLSLLKLIFLLIERSSKPSIRTWGPRTGITIIIKTHNVAQEKKHAHQESAEHIRTLSTLLDTLPSRPTEEEQDTSEPKPVNPESVHVEPLINAIDRPTPNRLSISTLQSPPFLHGR